MRENDGKGRVNNGRTWGHGEVDIWRIEVVQDREWSRIEDKEAIESRQSCHGECLVAGQAQYWRLNGRFWTSPYLQALFAYSQAFILLFSFSEILKPNVASSDLRCTASKHTRYSRSTIIFNRRDWLALRLSMHTQCDAFSWAWGSNNTADLSSDANHRQWHGRAITVDVFHEKKRDTFTRFLFI